MTLQQRMKEKNISCYQVAKETGIPYTVVNSMVRGVTSLTNCAAGNVYRIAKYFDLTVESLLEEESLDEKNKKQN